MIQRLDIRDTESMVIFEYYLDIDLKLVSTQITDFKILLQRHKFDVIHSSKDQIINLIASSFVNVNIRDQLLFLDLCSMS